MIKSSIKWDIHSNASAKCQNEFANLEFDEGKNKFQFHVILVFVGTLDFMSK